MYRIDRIKKIELIREYKGEKSFVEEKILAICIGSVHVYQDIFCKECQYSYDPVLVGMDETLSIGSMVGIESFCTPIELMRGRISKNRLVEIYNQINLPEYAISIAQLQLQKKYGD